MHDSSLPATAPIMSQRVFAFLTPVCAQSNVQCARSEAHAEATQYVCDGWQVRAAQQVQVEIDKPIGLNFKKANGKGGGLTVTVSTQALKLNLILTLSLSLTLTLSLA